MMFSGNGLGKFGNFFRRSDSCVLWYYPLWDVSCVPDFDGHRGPWIIFFGMFLKIILSCLLEFSEVRRALCCNDLEMRCCFLLT